MAEYKFYLTPPAGFVLLQNLRNVIVECFSVAIQFNIGTNIGSFSVGFQQPAELIENPEFKRVQAILEQRGQAEVISLSFQTQGETYLRESLTFTDNRKDGAFFNFTTPQADANRIIQVFDALSKHLPLSRRAEIAFSQLPDGQKEALQIAAQINNDFSAQAARLSQASTRHSQEVATLLCEKTDELDKRFVVKESALEERYLQKISMLELREKEHEATVKAFELRNNTAVRRDLLGKIREIIGEQEDVKISEGTVRKRIAVHTICIVTMLAAAILCGLFVYRVLAETAVDWHFFVPLSASTLIFVSTGIYYVKWNDRWFRDHATAEFTNRKFAADILRASWLAELVFEWESKKETQFPAELLQAFARGLFTSEVTDGSNKHPFEELSGAMKDFQTLRIGKGNFELSKKETKPSH